MTRKQQMVPWCVDVPEFNHCCSYFFITLLFFVISFPMNATSLSKDRYIQTLCIYGQSGHNLLRLYVQITYFSTPLWC